MTRLTPQALSDARVETTSPLNLRFITFNIRLAAGASERFRNEEAWQIRCPRVCAGLLFHSVLPETFIGLQEVLHSQLVDITSGLNDAASTSGLWAHIGVGRDDGKAGGEYEPIFYRRDIWKLRHERYLWLSETPHVPSRGWDAACTRVMSIGEFEHYQTGRRVMVINTHLDHEGTTARAEAAKLILRTIEEYNSTGSALILTGDFNSEPDGSAYQIMTARESSMEDVMHKIAKERRHGNESTYTTFGPPDKEVKHKIDFIFARKDNKIKAKSYAVLSNRFEDDIYASDHRPVVADLEVPA